jgi:hypothetical protein
MPQHDDKIKLKQMLDHANEAVEMVRGKEKSDLQKIGCLNWPLLDSLKFLERQPQKLARKIRRSILISPGRKLLACATG